MLTVADLIKLLTEANDMNDIVYVDTRNESMPLQLEEVSKNSYRWGFVIGKVDAE